MCVGDAAGEFCQEEVPLADTPLCTVDHKTPQVCLFVLQQGKGSPLKQYQSTFCPFPVSSTCFVVYENSYDEKNKWCELVYHPALVNGIMISCTKTPLKAIS